jgi:translation initiation factor 2 alpha subunit (eIF-2alpha)
MRQHFQALSCSIYLSVALQEMYKKVAWPLYRIYGHAFDAMKTMVADDGAGIFKRLEEDNAGPIEVLTPEVCVLDAGSLC